ncbi:MAG: twin-arginine translocase TatA/TatE family subunit [Opitutaceae bacterium]|nr:twin-arginine translocase TatA/TatE family subunit [Opitutaceae bacterium]MBP9912796.1 twin-arginine translocase TatA/TatE family subunit [Opitutaceae bacterium]
MLSVSPYNLAFIEGVGGPELLMIMFVVLLLFGGQKLPELAKGLGKSIREFKKATSGVEEEFKRAIAETPETPPAPIKPKPPVPLPAADERHDPPQA